LAENSTLHFVLDEESDKEEEEDRRRKRKNPKRNPRRRRWWPGQFFTWRQRELDDWRHVGVGRRAASRTILF